MWIWIVLCLSWCNVSVFAVDYAPKARYFYARAEQQRCSAALQRTTCFFCKQDERYYKRMAKKYRRLADYYTRKGKWERAARLNDKAEEAAAKAEQNRLKSQLALDSINIYSTWANNLEDIATQCLFVAAAEDFEQQLHQSQKQTDQ